MAVERGTLQHLIFDNHALASHRAMAAVLGAVLRLPPLQRSMAVGQLGSRYLEKLVERARPAQEEPAPAAGAASASERSISGGRPKPRG